MINAQQITLVSGRVSGVTNTTVTVPLVDGVTSFAGLGNYQSLIFLINFTAGGTATGTVNLYIEDSLDGGTTWSDMVSSVQFVLGAAASKQLFIIQGQIATTITQGAAPAVETLAAGTVRSGPFGDRIRIREKVAGTAGTPVGCTYSISLIPNRSANE